MGIPGLYVTGDPGAATEAQEGTLEIRFGLGWAKSHAYTGQCPVKKYNRGLMMASCTTRPRSPRP